MEDIISGTSRPFPVVFTFFINSLVFGPPYLLQLIPVLAQIGLGIGKSACTSLVFGLALTDFLSLDAALVLVWYIFCAGNSPLVTLTDLFPSRLLGNQFNVTAGRLNAVLTGWIVAEIVSDFGIAAIMSLLLQQSKTGMKT